MPYSLDFVKEVIENFVLHASKESTQLSGVKNAGNVMINRSIFDIESYLVKLREHQNVNNRLDTSIVSENILRNFGSVDPKNAFSAGKFQLPFMKFLAQKLNRTGISSISSMNLSANLKTSSNWQIL